MTTIQSEPVTTAHPFSQAHLNGAGLIAQERVRQLEKEGYTPGHDKHHAGGELAAAGAAYAAYDIDTHRARGLWPWPESQLKPKGRLQNLIRAGALIAAEIDRLQQAKIDAESPNMECFTGNGKDPRIDTASCRDEVGNTKAAADTATQPALPPAIRRVIEWELMRQQHRSKRAQANEEVQRAQLQQLGERRLQMARAWWDGHTRRVEYRELSDVVLADWPTPDAAAKDPFYFTLRPTACARIRVYLDFNYLPTNEKVSKGLVALKHFIVETLQLAVVGDATDPTETGALVRVGTFDPADQDSQANHFDQALLLSHTRMQQQLLAEAYARAKGRKVIVRDAHD